MDNGKLLKIPVVLILLLTLIVPGSINTAESFSATANPNHDIQVNVLKSTPDYLDIQVRFPANPLRTGNGDVVFDETLYSRPSTVGVPDLPVIRRDFKFPNGADYTLDIIETQHYLGVLGEEGLPSVIPNRPEEVAKCESDDICSSDEENNIGEHITQDCDQVDDCQILQDEFSEGEDDQTCEPEEDCLVIEDDPPANKDDQNCLPDEDCSEDQEDQNVDDEEEGCEIGELCDEIEVDDQECDVDCPTDEDVTSNADEDQDCDSEEACLSDDDSEDSITEEVQCEIEGNCEEDQGEIQFNKDSAFPESPVDLLDTYIIRGHHVGQLAFWPVQYDATNQTVLIYEEITIRISFTQTRSPVSRANAAAYSSYAFDKLLASQIVNYSQEKEIQTTRDTSNEGILIIAPNAFVSALSPLVSLKESQGHPVHLASLSTTGNTPQAIRAYIHNAYHNWSLPPTYVLLVGDVNNGANTMPAFIGESTGTVTDLYYGTVDGSDWIPDVFVGRLPARDTNQLNIMINNLIAYNNLTGTESWVKRAAFLASNDSNFWDVAEGTQNYVIDNHTKPAGYTGTFPSSNQAGGDKLYAHTYNATNANVVNAINNRRALISFTGHGSRVSWGAPGYSQSNIRNISHTGTYSVVTSFACITGDFETTESFGETWLLQPNKGAVAFIGSSANSYWGPDDQLERAMMDALYSSSNNANIVSSFLHQGLMAVEQFRPGTGTAQSRYYWETYNLLGDPSLAMLIEPKQADFTLSVNPTSVSVCQGASGSTTVTLGQINGFNSKVNLSTSGLPSGVSASFSQNPVTPPNTSDLSLSANSSVSAGDYALLVQGSSGSLARDTSVTLSIFSSNPSTVNLISPSNQATNIPRDQSFTWETSQANQTYEIQIALDEAFTKIQYSQTGLTYPSYTPPTELNGSTTYYWRVRVSNACGTGTYSNTFQFKTVAAPGECPAGTALSPLYQTDFENAPSGWTSYGVENTWVRSTNRSYSPVHSFYAKNLNRISEQHLASPSITLPKTNGRPIIMNFWHWFEIEASNIGCFDGGLLEITTNDGQTWTQIDNSKLLTNPYSGNISVNYDNPRAGSPAWCGSQDWSQTVVDLTEYAGKKVRLRFTMTSDTNIGYEGWYLDDFSVSACTPIPDYQPALDKTHVTITQSPGSEATLKIELTNAGLKTDTYSLNLTASNWTINNLTTQSISLQPGQKTELEISITVPKDITFGQKETYVFSAISTNDPDNPPATATATIELKANILQYIPLFTN